MSNPAYGSAASRVDDLVGRLRTFCSANDHTFWAGGVSLHDARLFRPQSIAGHRQLTGVYLLGLARRMRGRLATFDRTIPLAAVVGATRNDIAVVAPAE